MSSSLPETPPTAAAMSSALKYVLYIGFAVRFALPTLIPSLPYMVSSVEVTTPITSFKSLQEGFYYLKHGINPYEGGVNHHPPLLIALLYTINELPLSYVVMNLLYALADIWIATRMVKLNQWYYKHKSKNLRKDLNALMPFADHLIACFYLFNPLIYVTNLSHSTLVFSHLFLVESVYQVCIKSTTRGVIMLALSAYINFTPVYLIVPLLSLAYTVTGVKQQVLEGAAIYIVAISFLTLVSFAMTSSWQYLDSCYVSVITFKKISPNLGLWWYFFTEMFAFFNPFFIGVFNLFSVVFIVPITIRYSEVFEAEPQQNEKEKEPQYILGDAFLSVVISLTWLNFTKQYPTLGDLGIILSVIPIFRTTFLTKIKFAGITGLFLFGSLLLSPIFYYCWIVLGNGNSNFFYSINLVWGGVYGGILLDLLWSKAIFDYINENGVSKKKQETLRLSQI